MRDPWRPPRPAELVVLGEFFLEMVFYEVAEAPRFGVEVRAGQFSETPGGGVATTSMVAAGLGTSTSAITRVGKDALRREPWSRVQKAGVDTSASEIHARASTAVTVCVAHRRERMMITWDPINRNLERLIERPAAQAVLRRARHLHLACALDKPRRWLPILDRLRERSISISADIGWNPALFRSKDFRALLRRLDFIFPNEIEACGLTGQARLSQAARALSRWTKWPVVKLGRRGSILAVEGKILRAPALPVRVVDATGAGDAFNGGFLHGYLRGWNWMDCLRAGNVCGALATRGPGGSADLPGASRIARLMRSLAEPRT
jgi:sugar/nucleoside kinase (ribokinase family)